MSKTVRFPSTGRTVRFSKPKADDYDSPKRTARRAKKRAARRAAGRT
jgi:hypothetical protein